MQFVTHSDPVHDMGGTSNMKRKPWLLRRLISAFMCSIIGHELHGSGHANGHIYSAHEWKIGRYCSCKKCQARVFDLKDADQFSQILHIENRRWTEYFAQKRQRKTPA